MSVMTEVDSSQVNQVLEFWFQELEPADWWRKSSALDQDISSRFGSLHTAASAGECWAWRSSVKGRLAEVIVLDQFSRNMFRETPDAFSSDPLALILAQEAVSSGLDTDLNPSEQAFLIMPFMHSESLKVHEKAVELYSRPGLEFNLDFEYRHKAIIERFGRYPHRNNILGRESTPEELEFLKTAGSSF